MNKFVKRFLVPAGIVSVILLGATGWFFSQTKAKVSYDNGMILFDIPNQYQLTEDYSYNTTSLIMMAPLEDDVPQGIISIQIDTDLTKLENKTASELFESEQELFQPRNYKDLSSNDMTCATWDLTSNNVEMQEMYAVISRDANTKITMRALLNKEYFVSHQQSVIGLVDDIDVYGTRVLVAGNRVQESLEQQVERQENEISEESLKD